MLQLLRPGREAGVAPAGGQSPEPGEEVWASAAPIATVGIFVLLLGASLYVCRPILLPVVSALVIGTTLAPIVKGAVRVGISPWATAVVLGAGLVVVAGTAATLLAGPVSEGIAAAPEIGAAIKQKLVVVDRPLAALRELQEVLAPSGVDAVTLEQSRLGMVTPVIAFVTPAAAQVTLFFVTLIFFPRGLFGGARERV